MIFLYKKKTMKCGFWLIYKNIKIINTYTYKSGESIAWAVQFFVMSAHFLKIYCRVPLTNLKLWKTLKIYCTFTLTNLELWKTLKIYWTFPLTNLELWKTLSLKLDSLHTATWTYFIFCFYNVNYKHTKNNSIAALQKSSS